MKKVFSLEKYKESCRLVGFNAETIAYFVKLWAGKCEGLTEKEMAERQNCITHDAWMVEVEG